MRSGLTLALALTALGCGGSNGSGDSGGAGAGGTGTAGQGAAGAAGQGAAGQGAAGTSGAAGAGGAPCATSFTACGGDVVGTWKTDERCSPPGKVGGNTSSCAGEMFDFTQVRTQIGWVFRADHSMTLMLSASGPARMVLPDSCLAAATTPIACTSDGIGKAFGVSFPGGKPTPPTCTDASGTCTCTLSIDPSPLNETGTYQVAGSTLTIGVMDDAPLAFDYCATATTLNLREHNANGSAGDVLPFVKQ